MGGAACGGGDEGEGVLCLHLADEVVEQLEGIAGAGGGGHCDVDGEVSFGVILLFWLIHK